jgi:hypothetical protein
LKPLIVLKKNQPTLRALKKKAAAGKLKINRSNVEKEAALSVGVLRNHDDVVAAIKSAASASEAMVNTVEAQSSGVQLQVMEERIKKAKADAREQARLKTKHYESSKRDEAALSKQVAQQAMIVQALLKKVPQEDREDALRGIVRAKGGNVIKFKWNVLFIYTPRDQ